jgi:hypothetical protein
LAVAAGVAVTTLTWGVPVAAVQADKARLIKTNSETPVT